MISTPAPPQPTDPNKTAAAQAGMNRDTAIAQMLTNQTDQYSPQGSLTYKQVGENSYVDSKGKTVTIPKFSATTTLSPEEQKLYDLGTQTKANIGQIGVDQSRRIGDLLASPVNLNNEAVEQRLYDLGSKRLDPRFAQEEDALRTRLSNQGIAQNSEAWNRAMTQFGQTKNDAYNQLMLTGRGQSIQEILQQRNQPINEISALLSGSQVSMPQQIQTPQAPVAGVDYVGLVNNYDNMRMQAYNQQQAQRGAALGGIFGMLGSGISMFSDKNVKDVHRKVGKLNDGTPLYEWNYKGDTQTHIGPMAQDVKKTNPEAVGKMGGILTVDYGKLMEGQ